MKTQKQGLFTPCQKCDGSGYGPDYEHTGMDCPECLGVGGFFEMEPQEDTPEARRARIHRRLRSSGLY